MELKIKRTHPNAVIPTRGHPTDSGLDLTPVAIDKWIDANTVLLDTGIAVEPPDGFYTQVVPRSSMSKLGIIMPSSMGIIDASYRGSIKIPVRVLSRVVTSCTIDKLLNKRICQLLVKPLHICEVVEVDDLSDTVRGDGGIGSTGT